MPLASSAGVRFMTVNLMEAVSRPSRVERLGAIPSECAWAAGPAGGETYTVVGCASWSFGHYGPSREFGAFTVDSTGETRSPRAVHSRQLQPLWSLKVGCEAGGQNNALSSQQLSKPVHAWGNPTHISAALNQAATRVKLPHASPFLPFGFA